MTTCRISEVFGDKWCHYDARRREKIMKKMIIHKINSLWLYSTAKTWKAAFVMINWSPWPGSTTNNHLSRKLLIWVGLTLSFLQWWLTYLPTQSVCNSLHQKDYTSFVYVKEYLLKKNYQVSWMLLTCQSVRLSNIAKNYANKNFNMQHCK